MREGEVSKRAPLSVMIWVRVVCGGGVGAFLGAGVLRHV